VQVSLEEQVGRPVCLRREEAWAPLHSAVAGPLVDAFQVILFLHTEQGSVEVLCLKCLVDSRIE